MLRKRRYQSIIIIIIKILLLLLFIITFYIYFYRCTFKEQLCLFVFLKEKNSGRICLLVLSESSMSVLLSNTFVVSNNVLREPCLLLTNSSFALRLSELRGWLIWVKFVKIPKQKFESQLNVINPCSVLLNSMLFQPIRDS